MTIVSFFDTETTGLKPETDRIIEIAIAGYDLETEQKKFEFVRRIFSGKAIDPKAQLIHKISMADLIGKPTFAEVEPFITKIFEKSDIAVAHNLNFDVDFLLHEYQRIKKPLPDVQGFDTMADGRWATSFGKLPNLGELCWACEVDYEPDAAHSALYDIDVLAKCFFFAVKHGGFSVKELLSK